MNGAEALLQTLINADVKVCFANPGTSEMQFVAAIDKISGMRPVLTLFEGVATGAADGYGRMTGKPAATLLHLGPGLANGMANLHNAQRACSPIINIIGEHASYHLSCDAPLTSDLEGHAKLQSGWYKTADSCSELPGLGAEAVQAALVNAGQIASIIVPADFSWTDGAVPIDSTAIKKNIETQKPVNTNAINESAFNDAVQALVSDGNTAILLGSAALLENNLQAAGKIAAHTNASLFCETFPARLQRGAGRITPQRIPYLGEMAADTLKEYDTIILIGAQAPVSFFAYPGLPSRLSPDKATIIDLIADKNTIGDTLNTLVNALNAADVLPSCQSPEIPPIPDGPLTAEAIAACVAALMPQQAIVSDESVTGGLSAFPMTAGCPEHDWLTLTGGAIGQGMPVAIGAAIACPTRKTICLQADGAAMYTLQSLWTMAREKLDITTVIYNNRSYAILNFELFRVGIEQPGEKARSMLDLSNPDINWVYMANSMGVKAVSVNTVEQFYEQFAQAMVQKGPFLIDAQI